MDLKKKFQVSKNKLALIAFAGGTVFGHELTSNDTKFTTTLNCDGTIKHTTYEWESGPIESLKNGFHYGNDQIKEKITNLFSAVEDETKIENSNDMTP